MTQHDHPAFDPECYRCDLSLYESASPGMLAAAKALFIQNLAPFYSPGEHPYESAALRWDENHSRINTPESKYYLFAAMSAIAAYREE